jgi:hypothetical protein
MPPSTELRQMLGFVRFVRFVRFVSGFVSPSTELLRGGGESAAGERTVVRAAARRLNSALLQLLLLHECSLVDASCADGVKYSYTGDMPANE